MLGMFASVAAFAVTVTPAAAQKKPNVVILMTDDAFDLKGLGHEI